MSTLILPESVTSKQRRDEALFWAQDHRIREFNGWLKNIDPHLKLVFANEKAQGPGIQAGRWHVCRQAPGCVPTYLVISTNGVGVPGGFREPDSGVLDSLRRADSWRRDLLAEQLAAERSEERAKDAHREARRDELAINIKAKTNPGIRFGGSWTAKAGK
jgi:hypothetical protein